MGRNRRPIVVAAILTVVAMLLIWYYTKSQERQIVEQYKPELGEVYIAVDDIPTGTTLTAAHFVKRPKPLESLPENRILSEDEFVGKTNTVTIFKDQFLIPDFLQERNVEFLSAIIPSNKRATTISINAISGVGGHLVPGDAVDIVGAFDAEIAGYPTTLTLFDNVHILAVGLQTQRMSAEAAEGDRSATTNATNLTLSISPQDVKKLMLAEQYGELKLALRGDDDDIPIPPAALPLPSLLEGLGVDPFAREKREMERQWELARMEAYARSGGSSGADEGEEDEGPVMLPPTRPSQRVIKVYYGSEEKDYFLIDSGTSGLDDLGGMNGGMQEDTPPEDKEKEIDF
jgi:pilus assembly protein CpaB